jgi:hypothetical protein
VTTDIAARTAKRENTPYGIFCRALENELDRVAFAAQGQSRQEVISMRKRMVIGLAAAAAVVGVIAGTTATLAHHAFAAEFDSNRPVNLRGKVTRVEWINPHAWIHIDHAEAGKMTPWMVEGGTPNTLLRRGINKDSLKVGTEIVVRGYQSKDALCVPKCRANGRDVTFPDGRKLFMGSSGTGAPTDGSDPTEKK